VISTRHWSEPGTISADPAPSRRRPVHVADLFLPVSVALWVLGVRRTNTAALGPYGLPAVLPIVFYAGLALLVVSAGTELARRRPSQWRMSVHVVALVVMLYGTAPLVYSEGRYSWLYKTIGVVQYINAHGQLNPHIDIYQNWPGFFALAAWFGKVADVASPLAYAKWAQLAFELAALPVLYLIYDTLSLTVRQRWLALLLYSASNWIGQDYFSPQALGTLLSLGIMAIALRWLYVGNSSRDLREDQASAIADRAGRGWRAMPAPRTAMFCVTLVLVYIVLTFTHELSPYMLAVQLGALVVARLLRPGWLPLALAIIAVGYLLPRFSFVNSHYGLLKSIGSFLSNATPPSLNVGPVPGSELLIERCADALSISMVGLALAGAWLHRRSGPTVLSLVLLAFSPIVLLAVHGYGSEGILRVYLFSLPWTAALAATALASKPGSHRAARTGLTALRISVALGLILALFFPSFFGDDSFNMMPEPEVTTVTSFLQSASAGPLYCAIDNAPLADTSRYNLFPVTPIFGSYSLMGTTTPVTPDIVGVIAANSLIFTNGDHPAYVMVTPSMTAYNQAYRVTSPSSFSILLSSLTQSRAWKLIVHRAGVLIYELPPTPAHLYSGPWKLPELKMPPPLPPLLTTAPAGRNARERHKAKRRPRRTTVSPALSPQP
jgi:hypothetical protein